MCIRLISIHATAYVPDAPPPCICHTLGQENSAFDICVDAFNCVWLRLREFNLRVFVYLSMRLDALSSNS